VTAPAKQRLGEIEALAEGLTDLCAEHQRQSIRHVQRNCDIDCNTHEDETTWDDCKQPDRYDGERMAKALSSIPYLLTELRKRDNALAKVEALAEEIAAESIVSRNVEREIRKGPPSMLSFVHAQHATIANNHAARIRAAVTAAKGDGDQ